ncbi:hypothetical protein [Sporosarcina koreensis]|uniref:Uncharacterized protein n=1 Tax=Sporosarcina koreensis TaxID=334735 RepID=A0ABW0U0P1_9BACL
MIGRRSLNDDNLRKLTDKIVNLTDNPPDLTDKVMNLTDNERLTR